MRIYIVSDAMDGLYSSILSLKDNTKYVYLQIKVKFSDPAFQAEMRQTRNDTFYQLPYNFYLAVRGVLQSLHVPSVIIRSIESPDLRVVTSASVKANARYMLIASAVVNGVNYLPYIDRYYQNKLTQFILSPVSSRMFVNNIFHTTVIAKVFGDECPNNKHFESCGCGRGAQNSADIESLFRFASEMLLAGMVSFIPYIGENLSLFLMALANAQYMIELKLSMAGMCSDCRRDIFVNNSAYVLGYNLGLLGLHKILNSVMETYVPFLSNAYTSAIFLQLLTQLFSMVAFLQHGPFLKRDKGKDLLSRDIFYFTHAFINFIISEVLDHVGPRLEDPLYRARQANNFRRITYYTKLPLVIFTNRDMYSIDRWLDVPPIKLFLKYYAKDIQKCLEPVDLVKDKMKKLPDWLSKHLSSMSNILAYCIYFLWNIKLTDKQLETAISILNDDSFNQIRLKLRAHLKKFDPNSEDQVKKIVLNEGHAKLKIIENQFNDKKPPVLDDAPQTVLTEGEITGVVENQFHAEGPPLLLIPPEIKLHTSELNTAINEKYVEDALSRKKDEKTDQTTDSEKWQLLASDVSSEAQPPMANAKGESYLRLLNLFPINIRRDQNQLTQATHTSVIKHQQS